jgi:hypothetical protein
MVLLSLVAEDRYGVAALVMLLYLNLKRPIDL